MVTIAQRLSRPWVRAVTTGVVGAGIVTAIFVLAGGQVSERVVLIPLIYAGAIGVVMWLPGPEGQGSPP